MLKGRHGVVLGVVCVLHLYGKGLNLNSYVHVLFAEGGLVKFGEWVFVSFLECGVLWRVWQYRLLTMVRRVLSGSLENKLLVNWLFSEYGDGFYVYVKCRVSKPCLFAGYVGR